MKKLLLAWPEKVMEDTQAVLVLQGPRPAVELAEGLAEVGVHPMEVGPGLLNAPPGQGDGDVLVLHQIVALRRLFGYHGVVLLPVGVQAVPTLAHEHAALEVGPVETGDC